MIQPEAEPRLHSMIRTKLKEIGCLPIATGGIEDHVHVLCKYEPTMCISDLVKRIKGSSSHFMNDEVVGADLLLREVVPVEAGEDDAAGLLGCGDCAEGGKEEDAGLHIGCVRWTAADRRPGAPDTVGSSVAGG